MKKSEARTVALSRLQSLRGTSWSELKSRYLNMPDVIETETESGAVYQVEILAFWDGVAEGDLRVVVSVDDGGWRAIVPLTEDFIVSPDGSFVGE